MTGDKRTDPNNGDDMNAHNRPWPTELRLSSDGRTLRVTFDDGSPAALEAEYLRVESPSAEVQGHGAAQKKLVLGKENVVISGVEPVGNYAIRLQFDDGHDSGLFTWDYLHELFQEKDARKAEHSARIAQDKLA